jgi:predicted kinase
MARLIHLNGPPGIGKSTIARRYVDAQPGTLNLDIDVLRTLIGGWRNDFSGSGALIRPAAIAMATAYLAAGHDVVLPQLIARLEELRKFEAAALDAGAEFREVVLMTSKVDALARFHSRRGVGQDADGWHAQVQAIVRESGGDELLEWYHDQLVALLGARPDAVRIETGFGAIDATLAAVQQALSVTG